MVAIRRKYPLNRDTTSPNRNLWSSSRAKGNGALRRENPVAPAAESCEDDGREIRLRSDAIPQRLIVLARDLEAALRALDDCREPARGDEKRRIH
jgi:hypothetical protein